MGSGEVTPSCGRGRPRSLVFHMFVCLTWDVIFFIALNFLTGYKKWKGQILNADELGDLYTGLKENDIATYSHLLTGMANANKI